MKLITNSGNDRVIDELRRCLVAQATLDIASPAFSLFAFSELRDLLTAVSRCRIVVPSHASADLALLGSDADRPFRNRLQIRWLARQSIQWLEKKAEVRSISGPVPQAALITGLADQGFTRVISGNAAFTTEGLGITPGNQFGLISCSESAVECALLGSWFNGLRRRRRQDQSHGDPRAARSQERAKSLTDASHEDPLRVQSRLSASVQRVRLRPLSRPGNLSHRVHGHAHIWQGRFKTRCARHSRTMRSSFPWRSARLPRR